MSEVPGVHVRHSTAEVATGRTDGRDPRSIFMNGGEIQISVKQTSTKGTQTVKEKPLPVGKPAAGGSPSKPIIDHPGSDSMKKPEQ